VVNAGALVAAGSAPDIGRRLRSGRAWRVLYHSGTVTGDDVVVSALVLVPPGRQPRGGWPVVAWAHGTTGVTSQCAPSLSADLGHDPSAVAELRGLVRHGFAVVASDYPGLGTPGVHPYLIGQANANATIDAVTSAHKVAPSALSRRWVVVGHSQGGQTALFVAQDASRRAPRWDYRGAVALAPASHLDALVALAEVTHDPTDQAYLIYAIDGLGTVDPSIQVNQLLTADAQTVTHDLIDGCIDQITEDLTNRQVSQVLAADPAAIDRLRSELGRYDNPDQQPADGPVLVTQGTTDTDVPVGATDGLVTQLCGLGDHIQYRRYDGLDHEAVVSGSLPDVTNWINDRIEARDTPNTCPAMSASPETRIAQ
jgi:pimeloyl-ACP methyl ester carboxylesterase